MKSSDIQKIAHLARLQINEETADETARSITEVLALVDQLQSVDTEGVEPMAHPMDAIQTLRADEVSEASSLRESFQKIAPITEDGLYLVPKVIE